MNDMSRIEHGGKPKIEGISSVRNIDKAADKTKLNRLKNLVPDKARHVIRLSIQKTAVTASGLFLLVSSGCGNVENTTIPTPIDDGVTVTVTRANPTPEPDTEGVTVKITRAPTITPEPTPTQKPPEPENEYKTFDSIKVAIDKDGLPVSYLPPDGKEIKFDKVEMQNLKDRAILNKEPEIITIIDLPASKSFNPETNLTDYTEMHPRVLELPKDVLSNEELQKRGVTIVQSDKTNLYIRSSAFEPNGPLADFNYPPQKKLTVVLIDGPIVSRDFIDSNQPFARLLPLSDTDAKGYRSKKIAQAEEQLKRFRASSSTQPDELLWLKAQIYKYQKLLTDKEIAAEITLTREEDISGDKIGQHIYEYDYERDSNENPISSTPTKRTTIFLAVGENQSTNEREVLAFDRNGKLINNRFRTQLTVYDRSPQPKETHPNPSDIELKGENPEGYLYEPSGVGFASEHEVGHHKANLERNNSERNADMYAMNTIRKAWEAWRESGYKNNRMYPFAFSLSPEKGGGYILTEHKQPNPNTSTSRKT